MRLLKMLRDGLPGNDIVEMIKRLHVPGYERARLHAGDARSEGAFEPSLPEGFYLQDEIESILEWANENEREP